jgi:hypothetical protein
MHGFVVVLVLVVLTSAALVVALDASRRHMDCRKEERVMFQWITHNGRGEREVFDLHALTLPPNGKRAYDLPPGVLFRCLAKMKVAGINVTMGAQDLLVAYARWLAATTRDPISGRMPEGDAA